MTTMAVDEVAVKHQLSLVWLRDTICGLVDDRGAAAGDVAAASADDPAEGPADGEGKWQAI